MADSKIAEVFAAMSGRFLPEKAAGVSATIQFDLTGDGGAQYHVSVADSKCAVAEGAAEAPNLVLTAAAADFVDMVNGRLNPTSAFMQGKIKLKGEMALAMKMLQFFNFS